MDNMEMHLANPQEDEFALCAGSLQSPCMSWVFPRQKCDFEKYLTLESLSADELAEWRKTFVWFLKKVQFVCDRPLLLKSPPHTARIRRLLELFPEAKFVHIHRHPFRTIRSSIRTFRIIQDWHGLQRPFCDDLEDWAIRQYVAMYEAFFDQKRLIPEGHFHEISFEALEKDPEAEMQELYAALNLPDFRPAVPDRRRYLQSVADYQKTRLADLPAELKQRVARDCRRCFEEWGYIG